MTPHNWPIRRFVTFTAAAMIIVSLSAFAARKAGQNQTVASPQDVLTYHGDSLRTGWFSSETQLTAANINSQTFGLLQTVTLDAKADAEPLVVLQQAIRGQGTHDVVYLPTANNSVYALDAESGATLWQVNLGPAVAVRNGGAKGPPSEGVMSTPVIDLTMGAIFVVADVINGSSNTFTLHALSLNNGADLLTPTAITFSEAIQNGGTWVFDPAVHLNRPALLEANGNIYVAFGSTGDVDPADSRGFILSFNAATLQQIAGQLIDLRNGLNPPFYLSSIWQSGYGPAADATGDVFFSTGNSDNTRPSYSALYNHPESIIHMSAALQLLDSFTPFNYFSLDERDGEVGSGGTLVLPDQPGTFPHLVIAGGKDGRAFLMNRDNLGGYTKGGPDMVLQVINQGPCWCGPAYFVGSNGTPYVVTGGRSGVTNWQLQTTSPYLVQQSTTGPTVVAGLPDQGGTMPVISSNGTTSGSAVVWFIQRPSTSSIMNPGTPVTLWAYSGADLTTPLFSAQAGTWLNANHSNAELVPTVSNGRVYIASNKQLQIFGLLGSRKGAQWNSGGK